MQSRSEFIKQSPKTITALITPFKNGVVDYDSLNVLMEHQIKNGIEGFIISGTTGESPTLEAQEVEQIFKHCQKRLTQDFPLWLGTGSNSTQHTIRLTQKAKELGASAALVCVPYYNKPSQRGLYEHFKSLCSLQIPIILYNVPGRTVVSLELETIQKLAQEENIYGLKEASGNPDFYKKVLSQSQDQLLQLSGDDSTYIDFLKSGGHGVISVASHVIPRQFVNWRKLMIASEFGKAQEDFLRYKKLIELLFIQANPIPVKKALQLMGLIESAELRLPLTELEAENTEKLESELKSLGIV